MRANPMALGIVHGCSGWSERVWTGLGPERSRPKRRRLVIGGLTIEPRRLRQPPPQLGHRLSRALDRHGARLTPAPHLHLDLARAERAAPDGEPHRAAQQLRVG